MRRSASPVLMFHEIVAAGDSPARQGASYARYVTAEDRFRQQLQVIRDTGFHGVSLGRLLAQPGNGAVAITFDDGCGSDLRIAAPALEELGFGATFFITVAWLGTPGFLAASQVRELADRGFEIGSHSLTHAYLSDLSDAELRREIIESRDRLAQITGAPIRHLSCPGGRWSARVAEVAREAGYECVADSSPVAWSPAGNRFRVGRFPVTRDIAPRDLERFLHGGGWKNAGLTSLVLRAAKNMLGNRRYDRLRSLILERRDAHHGRNH